MHRDQRLAAADVSVDQPRHDLVALRVETAIHAGLRHAVRELAAAQVAIRRHVDLPWASQRGVGRPRPVHVHLPHVEPVVVEVVVKLRAAGGQHQVRRPGGRQRGAVEVGRVQEVDAVDDHALLGGGLTGEHLHAVYHTDVLLNDLVAGAGGHVVAIRPHRRTRVVGEERPLEDVAMVGAGGIGRRADGVANRVRRIGRHRRGRGGHRRRRTWTRRGSGIRGLSRVARPRPAGRRPPAPSARPRGGRSASPPASGSRAGRNARPHRRWRGCRTPRRSR